MSNVAHLEHIVILIKLAQSMHDRVVSEDVTTVEAEHGGKNIKLTLRVIDRYSPLQMDFETKEWSMTLGGPRLSSFHTVEGDYEVFERDMLYIKLALS